MNAAQLAHLLHHLTSALLNPPSETRRLFHGRGRCWEGLEHITVDWLQGIMLVCLFREPQADQLQALQTTLRHLSESDEWRGSGAHSLLLQQRYLPDSPMQCLAGELPEEWIIEEDGLRFLLDLGRKQNTGLFLDMRLGRRWVREHAQGLSLIHI